MPTSPDDLEPTDHEDGEIEAEIAADDAGASAMAEKAGKALESGADS